MGNSTPGALLGARWPREHRFYPCTLARLAGDLQAALQGRYPLLHAGQAALAGLGRMPGGNEAAAIAPDFSMAFYS